MFVRSSIIQTRPETIDAGIEFVSQAVMPALDSMPGCLGLSMLVDRDNGRCIVTSSWKTEDEMLRSEDAIKPLRDQAVELLGAPAEVKLWEVAVMHRESPAPPDAWARLTWMKVDPPGLEHAVEVFRIGALPTIEAMPGFCSASLMINRSTGEAVSTVTFDGPEHLAAGRDRGRAIRDKATKEARAGVTRVEECQLAHAHLHVPELV